MGIKANIFSTGFWGCSGLQRKDGAVDVKYQDLKVHGDNKYLPGEIGWVCLQ